MQKKNIINVDFGYFLGEFLFQVMKDYILTIKKYLKIKKSFNNSPEDFLVNIFS